MNRHQLDEAFPTVVRYCGVLLTFVLIAASILGSGVELAAGYVAAAGMILFKTVKNAAANGND
jgi:general stress protein CsbA